MRVGVSGTRHGCTEAQYASACRVLQELKPTLLAHGDCVGVDEELATFAHEMERRPKIVCHPPADEAHRAFTACNDETLPPRTHFARNRDIVEAVEILVACPPCKPLPEKGGTAYTVRYCLKKGKPVCIVWPDGEVSEMREL